MGIEETRLCKGMARMQIRAYSRRPVAPLEGRAMVLRNPITPAIKAAIAAGAALSLISFKRSAAIVMRASAPGAFRTGGSRPLLQRIRSLLSRSAALQFGRRPPPATITPFRINDLGTEHREIVERIWRNLLHKKGGPDCEQVVRDALRRMRDDLHSERREEVLEDIGREIAFRQWCDEQTRPDTPHPDQKWTIQL